MNFNIEEMPKSRIAYIRQVGPYGAGNYALMEKLKDWAKSNDLFTDSAIILGISQDDPVTTTPENCRYDACVVISDDFEITDSSVSEAELPGGRYAVFTIPHTAEAVQNAWSEVFSQLADAGCQLDVSRPILERYIPAMVKKHLCEICVPI